MNSRRQQIIHNDTNRWLVSYADFITLLFAFFVVMYAISSVNLDKYKNISKTLDDSFRRTKLNSKSYLVPIEPAMKAPEVPQEPLGDLEGQLKDLDKELVKKHVHAGWTELEMSNNALFEKASAELSPEAITFLSDLGKKLRPSNYYISIEGHTDNKPIQNNHFASNWELSASRAAAVARVLSETGINAQHISAVGYGDQFPIADNHTENGRNKNRRVTIVISKDPHSKRLLNPQLSKEKSQ